MKIICSTGGTAGHIFPALATIDSLCTMYPDAQILFLGGEHGLEKELVKESEQVSFQTLPIRGFMGKGFGYRIRSLFALGHSLWKAFFLFLRFKPNVVIGFGGYASFPALCIAVLLRKPIILHEQNSILGTVNAFFARFATRLCLSFELNTLPPALSSKRIVMTGNPVRSTLCAIPKKTTIKATRILIMGGSLGARFLNSLLIRIAPILLKNGFEIWHQTGTTHYQDVLKQYREIGIEDSVIVEPFIQNMQEAYAWADFAICRSGATTITELSLVALPALFIPLPTAIYNHQYYNAMALVNAQASLCIEEKDATDECILLAIEKLASDGVLENMKANIRQFAKPHASDDIVNEIVSAIKKK